LRMNIRNYWKFHKALRQEKINALFEDDMGDRYD
jgi:hypothetical protein